MPIQQFGGVQFIRFLYPVTDIGELIPYKIVLNFQLLGS